MKESQLHLEAPAKINLVLRVLGRRVDGYHELVTWMQKVSLCDSIHLQVKARPGLHLSCSDEGLPAGPKNLLWQAAELFFSRSKRATGCGATIYLEKKIPVSAGLGGGSSDAGTVLKALNQYFGHEFGQPELIEMGKSLGADVPFFVTDYSAVLATGIGEKMVAISPLRDVTFILINPDFFVSTAWVFENFALTRGDKNSTLPGPVTLSSEDLDLSAMENDLEAVINSRFPIIEEMKDSLKREGAAKVLMSGSGPTVFGVFEGSHRHQKVKIESALFALRSQFGERVFALESRNGV